MNLNSLFSAKLDADHAETKPFVVRYLGIILLLLFVVIALFTFEEYGMSWDEKAQRKIGLVNYDYVFNESNKLLTFNDRDYGAALELPLILIEKAFNLDDSRNIFLMRHLIAHLFFLLGAFFIFKLIYFLYKNKILASIGFLMIVLHPVIYAHSFFNTKDIPFMSMFIICFYFFAKAFRRKTVKNFIFLGLTVGVLISLRIMGVLFSGCVLLFLLIDIIRQEKILQNIKMVIVFIMFSFLATYITWPFLWTDPIVHFIEAFENMSHFRWVDNVLFQGKKIVSTNLPWTYIPVWFSISTPLYFLIAGSAGVVIGFFYALKKWKQFLSNSLERNNILYLICFFVPIVTVIYLNSVLYDSWRQMFFIYPPFVLLGIYGLNFFYQKGYKTWIIGLSSIAFIFIVIFSISNFPFQHVYFNQLVNSEEEHIRHSYEMDYWGTSYKQSLEYILENDSSQKIAVAFENMPGVYNFDIISKDERKRLVAMPIEQANYFVTNFRSHPYDYIELSKNKFNSIKVGNNTISQTYKLSDNKLLEYPVANIFIKELEISKSDEYRMLLEYELLESYDKILVEVDIKQLQYDANISIDQQPLLVVETENPENENEVWKSFRFIDGGSISEGFDLSEGIVSLPEYELVKGKWINIYIWNKSKAKQKFKLKEASINITGIDLK